jgi:UDP-3-O-[3-hydroxymyristoyl] glucosamine N-acyltransferase
VIAAQTGISGSTKIGENVVIGGQVGLAGHLTIANFTSFQAQSGMGRSVKEEGTKWGGSPASPFGGHMRSMVVFNRLPELEKKVKELEKIIAELKKEAH